MGTFYRDLTNFLEVCKWFNFSSVVRPWDWLYRLFVHVKIKRIDFNNELYGIRFSCYM